MLSPGLTPERGPPIHVPFRFLFTAPVFLAAAGFALGLAAPQTSAHSYYVFGFVHLFTLGFLSMAMIGAFFQMVPVVAGLHIPESRILSWALHIPLTIGAGTMGVGFLLGHTSLAGIGGGLAASALVLFSFRFLWLLRKAERTNRTSAAMRHALWGLVLGLSAGLAAIGNHAGWWGLPQHTRWVSIHLTFILVAWVGLLIQGVTYQVVPMFLITAEYPRFVRHQFTRILLGLVTLRSMATGFLPEAGPVVLLPLLIDLCIIALNGGYAIITLRLIAKRRRKIRDPLADFFRASMLSLLAGLIFFTVARGMSFFGNLPASLGQAFFWSAGVFYLLGFAGSAINGMMYRIVPFLVYLHLTARGVSDAPTMKEMTPGKAIPVQFRLFVAALLAAALLPLIVWTMAAAASGDASEASIRLLQAITGLLTAASALKLLWNLSGVLGFLKEK